MSVIIHTIDNQKITGYIYKTYIDYCKIIINSNGNNEKINMSYFLIKQISLLNFVTPICHNIYKLTIADLPLLQNNQNSMFEIKYVSDKIHTIRGYVIIKNANHANNDTHYIVVENKIIYLEQIVGYKKYEECAICIEEIVNKVTLPCKHCFCNKCINMHVNESYTDFFKCPLCRTEYNKKCLQPLQPLQPFQPFLQKTVYTHTNNDLPTLLSELLLLPFLPSLPPLPPF